MILTLGKIVLILAELGLLLGVLRLLGRHGRWHPELLRKVLHVAMGLTVLSFPWLFDQDWPVLLLSGLATVGLIVLRMAPALKSSVGSVINGVARKSLGEIYYPIAVGALWLLADGDTTLFAVPVLVLALGDATAALIGVRYGSMHYQTQDGHKSIEGSLAFFVVTFLSVHIPVLLVGQTGRTESLLLAVIVGLLVMLLESVAWRGLDNLLVPLGTFAFLKLYLAAPADDLVWRTAAIFTLVVFVAVWRRRSTMDDSALVIGALFGYASMMLGGWLWLVPPLMLFVTVSLVWPRRQGPRVHSVAAVISITAVGMGCLLLQTRFPWDGWLWVFTASFASHLGMVGVSYLLYEPVGGAGLRIGRLLLAVGLGWLAVAGPIGVACAIMTSPHEAMVPLGLIVMPVVAAAAGFYMLMPWLYGRTRGSPSQVHTTAVTLVACASAATALLLAWAT
ncbi:MAG: hypothetical protein GVY24_05640 [Planctomycetes bacterium]|nr:hypothetical protein [Planctomycetota bacterium]